MNLAAVPGFLGKPVTGTWYRAIPPEHFETALNYSHTRLIPSRYNAGTMSNDPFDIIYLAETPIVAQLEIEALFGSSLKITELIPNPAADFTVLNVQVQLRNVLDLTDVEGCHKDLNTNAQELTGDWRAYQRRRETDTVSAPIGTAPTQELGEAIHRSELFAGFLAVSARLPYKTVLGVFPDRIMDGEFVRYAYTDTKGQKRVFSVT